MADYRQPNGPLKTVKIATALATGASDIMLLPQSCAWWSIVAQTGAGVSGGVIDLQLSLDGVNWFTTAAATITTNAANTNFAGNNSAAKPAIYARANASTPLTGGTADVWICGY